MFPQKSAKITPCTLCKSLRSSAEMVEGANNLGKMELFCSVNCLSAYRVKMVTSSGKFIYRNLISCGSYPTHNLKFKEDFLFLEQWEVAFFFKGSTEMGMKGHSIVDKCSSDSTVISVLVLGSLNMITNLKSIFCSCKCSCWVSQLDKPLVWTCAIPLLGLFCPLSPGLMGFITSALCCTELGKHFQLFFM